MKMNFMDVQCEDSGLINRVEYVVHVRIAAYLSPFETRNASMKASH